MKLIKTFALPILLIIASMVVPSITDYDHPFIFPGLTIIGSLIGVIIFFLKNRTKDDIAAQ